MTLDESNQSDLYRTTEPFRDVPIGEYKWVVTRSMYVGWQAAEQLITKRESPFQEEDQ